METYFALLAICAGNSTVTGEFPTQRPVMWSFDVFFHLRLTKRLSKQWWGWWFETPLCPSWRHCNEELINAFKIKFQTTNGWDLATSGGVTWSTSSHYLNQCWNIVNSDIRNRLQWNLKRNSYIFIQENAFENVVCEMVTMLSRPQCVKMGPNPCDW